MSGLKRKSDELVDVEQSFAKLKSTVEKEIALKETNIKYKQQESVHRFIEKTSENRNKAESFYKKHFESSQTKLRSIKSTLAEAKKEEENIDSQLVKIAAIKNDAVDLQQFQESQLQLLWREVRKHFLLFKFKYYLQSPLF